MRSILILVVLVLSSACAKKDAPATGSPSPQGKAPAVASSAAEAPAAAQPQLLTVSGTVLETMPASDYTYMRLKTSSGEIWAAVNKTKIAKGDNVTVANAMTMDGFESKTLNRTFDKIVFGVLAAPGGSPDAAVAPAAMMADHAPSVVARDRDEGADGRPARPGGGRAR